MAIDLPKTLWLEVVGHMPRDYQAYRTLTLVSKAARAGVFDYLNQQVIPLLAAQLAAYIHPLHLEGLTPLDAYKSLREALQKPYPTSIPGQKRTPLQCMVETGCRSLLTKEQFQSLLDLFRDSYPLAETGFQNQLPLVTVCYNLPDIFARKLEPSERRRYYRQYLEIFRLLLTYGVNPNLRAEKTPLIAILEQTPYATEDQELMSEMIKLLLDHGADPYTAPISRSGKKLPSAWKLAQKGPFKHLFPPPKSQETSPLEAISTLVSSLIFRN